MKPLLLLLACLWLAPATAQTPVLELSPRGFAPVNYSISLPEAKKMEELSRAWVTELKRRNERFDLSNLTGSSLTISGIVKNGFFYRSRGETFQHNIKLVMTVDFTSGGYTLKVTVPEIYAENETPLKYTLPDYFTDSGEIKEGYDGLKQSVEDTVNDVALNYYNYIKNNK